MIIVNTKKSAKELYNMVQGQVYHLSTYMTAYDRRRVIAEIHEELAKLEVDFPGLEGVPAERRIMVFSTSLIEAGVDFDFSVVFRELAGVDNILQAGGRCNREGKRKNAVTYIFELDSRPETEDKRREITRGILEEYEDISVPEAVNAYYQRVFKVRERNLTRNSMYQYCDKIDTIPFRKYAEQFELIDNRTVSIVVERDEISRELIQTVRYTGKGNSRKLQNYTCSVQLREFEELFKSGVVEDLGTGIYCLTNMDYYDRNLGITFDETDYFL